MCICSLESTVNARKIESIQEKSLIWSTSIEWELFYSSSKRVPLHLVLKELKIERRYTMHFFDFELFVPTNPLTKLRFLRSYSYDSLTFLLHNSTYIPKLFRSSCSYEFGYIFLIFSYSSWSVSNEVILHFSQRQNNK